MIRCAWMVVCVATAAFGQGVELGPAPISNAGDTGRVSAVACHPTNASLYYVGGADGGLWKTTDAGTTWTPLGADFATFSIGAVTLSPTNPNVVYVGTGEGNFANHSRSGVGIYRSMDAGATWALLGESVFAGRCIAEIAVSPSDSQRLYVAVTRAGGFPEMAAAKGHPGANGPVGVFTSADGGATWTHLTNGLPSLSVTDIAMHPTDSQRLYAAVSHIFGHPDNGVYRSVDGGATWTRLAGGLPTTSLGRTAIAVAPTNPSRMYALVAAFCDVSGGGASTIGAYRSDNEGTTWTTIPIGSLHATYGWYLNVASVQPTNADVAILGGLNLRRTMNAGSSFTTITPPHVDMHVVAWDAAGRLVVGDDGGLHRSTDLGATWTPLNVGLGMVQFYAGLSTHPTDPVRVLGGTQDNGSNLRSTDTLTWLRVTGGDGGWTQWDQNDPQRIFTSSQGTGNLYLSVNGGGSFVFSRSGINTADRNCFLPPFLIHPTDSTRMLYATHRVYSSSTSGTSWTAISDDLTLGQGAIRALAQSSVDPQTVYAATNDARFLASVDGGATFALRLSDAVGWPRVTREVWADPMGAATVYLAGARFGGPHVRRSRDRGQTWEVLDGNLPDVPVNVIATDNRCTPPMLFAGTDSGLFRSMDDGATWQRVEGLPRACVIDLRPEPGRDRLVVGTQGRGAWTIPMTAGACPQACDGDVNCDFALDGFDVEAQELAVGGVMTDYCAADPDFNGDFALDGFDVEAVEVVVGGGPCP